MKENFVNISEEENKGEDKVVVEPKIQENTTDIRGGVAIAGCGKVLSVGTKVTAVKPGDEVTFDQTAGQDLLLYGKYLKIISENELTPVEEKET